MKVIMEQIKFCLRRDKDELQASLDRIFAAIKAEPTCTAILESGYEEVAHGQ